MIPETEDSDEAQGKLVRGLGCPSWSCDSLKPSLDWGTDTVLMRSQ